MQQSKTMVNKDFNACFAWPSLYCLELPAMSGQFPSFFSYLIIALPEAVIEI
jgi:hypothetical protein